MSSQPVQQSPLDADAVVEVTGLAKRFGARRVLERIDLTIERGETLAVVGGSGSGKSTLMRQMALLLAPTAGSIRLLGQTVSDLDASGLLRLRRHIGVLFQNGALFGGMTVLENIAVPLYEHTDLAKSLVEEIAHVKLALVGLDHHDGRLFPSQLSGGMRKRVALARAIALDPDVLFLDEPTSGLDPLSADAFDDLILDLKAALRPTIVLVTHDMDTLWRVADRVVLLGDARILASGTMPELARAEDPAVVRFFHSPRGRAAQASA